MIGNKQMENPILSCFGTMCYIFLKLVIKHLQLHYSNFISTCNTQKSTSFELRKIEKPFPPLSKTTFQPRRTSIFFKNVSFKNLSIFINHFFQSFHVCEVSVPILLLQFVLLVLPFVFQSISFDVYNIASPTYKLSRNSTECYQV